MEEYNELSIQYMQIKQRLAALMDKDRITQIRLEKHYARTQDETLIEEIQKIIDQRETLIEACRRDLNELVWRMAKSDYQKKHFLDTPLKQALFAHDLKSK